MARHKLTPEDSRAKKPIPWDVAMKVLNIMNRHEKDKKFVLMFLLGIHLGMRFEELARVTKKEVQSREFYYPVYKNQKLVNGRKVIKRVRAFVPDAFFEKFEEMGFRWHWFKDKLFSSDRKKDKNINMSTMSKKLKKYCSMAGMSNKEIKGVAARSIRKTFADRMFCLYMRKYTMGESVLFVSRDLGHENTNNTLKYIGREDTIRDFERNNMSMF